MANPQLENGYARIANEIFDNIVKRYHKFNGTQYAIVLAVWRYTYGYGRKDHELAVSFIAEYLEGDLRGVKKELSYLIERKVLVVTEEAYGSKSRKLGFNKNYDQWLVGDKTPPRKKQSLGVQSSPSEGSNHTPRGGDDSPPKKESINKNIKKGEIALPSIHEEIISYLNSKTGKKYSSKVKTNKELINGRISEGRTIDDFKYVIDTKCSHWLNDPKMCQYLRPATLFRPSNFDNYLNQQPTEQEDNNPGQMTKDEKLDYEDAIREWVMQGNDPADFRFERD
ncbi:conserved phage C-terminal domain-containing protein [Paenibacillus sp. FSL H7-0703]|uniref:conserved phage C-terminal domain-containing protein n=1 Tax=Paenibacillus sp. FSL H7-0703 TaxID=2921438 RepID=UPI0030F73549